MVHGVLGGYDGFGIAQAVNNLGGEGFSGSSVELVYVGGDNSYGSSEKAGEYYVS